MQIFVKSLSGGTITFIVEPSDSIRSVKMRLRDQENIPLNEQQFIFAGKLLDNNHTLMHYDIQELSTIHLAIRFLSHDK